MCLRAQEETEWGLAGSVRWMAAMHRAWGGEAVEEWKIPQWDVGSFCGLGVGRSFVFLLAAVLESVSAVVTICSRGRGGVSALRGGTVKEGRVGGGARCG